MSVRDTLLLLYMVGMLVMGLCFMRRERGGAQFFKGSGRIPSWAAGISICATLISAVTFMSIPAKAYATDWTYYPLLWMIPIVCLPVTRWYLPYFRRQGVASAYEILERRFNLPTRLMASALFCVYMVARMALVMYLPSLALSAVTGIDLRFCILAMGLVTIAYCTMGGVEAVIWGDVVQGVILMGGVIFAALFLVLNTEGGAEGFVQIALQDDKLRLFDWGSSWSRATWWVVIVGGLANNLISYTSDQTVIQRYLITRDERSAAHGIWVSGITYALISVVFYTIGTALYTFYTTHPLHLDASLQHSDAIFPYFIVTEMPQALAGLLLAAFFAATMSTISSNINSIGAVFCIDFVQRFHPRLSDKALLRVARWSCLLGGLLGLSVALLMATWDIRSLLDYFNTILGLLTSGLGGLFFMAVFMKRVGGKAALCGFAVGELAAFVACYCTTASFFLYGAIGLVVSVVVAALLSWRE